MGNGEIDSEGEIEGEGEGKGEGEGDETGGGFSHEVSLIELSGGLAAGNDDNIPVGAELDDLVLQSTSCGEKLTLSFGAMP
jgi:hypothetical protein